MAYNVNTVYIFDILLFNLNFVLFLFNQKLSGERVYLISNSPTWNNLYMLQNTTFHRWYYATSSVWDSL